MQLLSVLARLQLIGTGPHLFFQDIFPQFTKLLLRLVQRKPRMYSLEQERPIRARLQRIRNLLAFATLETTQDLLAEVERIENDPRASKGLQL